MHCPYCDFAVDVRQDIPHEEYAGAVVAEVEVRAPWFYAVRDGDPPPLVSVYFGGGTPGLWRPASLGRILEAVRRELGVGGWEGREVTVEANPGEVSRDHLESLRRLGVNRVSLGAQSFDDDLLDRIGRNHDAASISPAIEAARAAGMEVIACDLMFGLPGQTMSAWQRSVEALLRCKPDHVSAYALTVERGTPFGTLERSGRLDRPDDETVARMFEWGRAALRAAGFVHYEVSSYARPGREAVHNSLYWTGGAYLGVGASASSFRPLDDGTGWRFSNPRAVETYLRQYRSARREPAAVKVERRARADLENEALWLGLRTSAGINRLAHARRYGADPLADPGRAAAASRCVEAGWLAVSEDRLWLTDAGFLVADEVASRLWR